MISFNPSALKAYLGLDSLEMDLGEVVRDRFPLGTTSFLVCFGCIIASRSLSFILVGRCNPTCGGSLNPSTGLLTHLTDGNFRRSSNTINGWLRDFLWSQSSQVIQSYGSATSGYGLFFLAGHFVWSFSLMFLFSGRGYWQELIESILWAHQQLNCAPSIYPRALSITQGRAVGVAHYLLGGIVTTWAFFLARRSEWFTFTHSRS
jgi:hypothetical protein